jgi:hypothetical protein
MPTQATAEAMTIQTEQELRGELVTVQQQTAMKISDQRTYDLAVSELERVKTWRKRWKEYWYGADEKSGSIPMAHAAWKAQLKKFNDGDAPAGVAESAVKKEILRFDQEQERIRLELQRKAEEEARQREEEQRAALAAQAEVEGATEDEIEQIVSAPSVAVAEVVEPTYQRSSSISFRDNWAVQITDLLALLKAIGMKKVKLPVDDMNKLKAFMESLLKPQATANKSTLCLPGCTAVNNKIPTGRIR